LDFLQALHSTIVQAVIITRTAAIIVIHFTATAERMLGQKARTKITSAKIVNKTLAQVIFTSYSLEKNLVNKLY
jgi:hypothetical protein